MKCSACGYAGCPLCLTASEREDVIFTKGGHRYSIRRYRKGQLDRVLAELRTVAIKGKLYVVITEDMGGLEKLATRTIEIPLYEWLLRQGCKYLGPCEPGDDQ